jgi:hypothetical protein
MDDLLSRVVEAHGGSDRWSAVNTLTVRMSIDGPLWTAKGWPNALVEETATLDARREHLVYTPFTAPDRRSEFDVDPEQIAIHTRDGHVIERCTNPRASFAGFERTTPWNAVQLAYFASYALWNYLTTPFLLTYPGVRAREIDPWDENGQTWRRLHVTFPNNIVTHNPEQVFYFGPDALLRRHDYAPEVNGNALAAHYAGGHKTFGDLVFPTRRRVHRRYPDGTADLDLALITIDLHDITINPHANGDAFRLKR